MWRDRAGIAGEKDQPRQLRALDARGENVLRFIVEKIDDVQLRIIPHRLRGDVHVRSAAQNDAVEAHRGDGATVGPGCRPLTETSAKVPPPKPKALQHRSRWLSPPRAITTGMIEKSDPTPAGVTGDFCELNHGIKLFCNPLPGLECFFTKTGGVGLLASTTG